MRALARDPAERYQTADELRRRARCVRGSARAAGLDHGARRLHEALFGERPEPWLPDAAPSVAVQVDFDTTAPSTPPVAEPEPEPSLTDVMPIEEATMQPAKEPLPPPGTRATPLDKPRLPSVPAKSTATEPAVATPTPTPPPATVAAPTVAAPTLPPAPTAPAVTAKAVSTTSTPKRAATDLDETTDVANPPPPPAARPDPEPEPASERAPDSDVLMASDSTAIVVPLPSPLVTDADRPRRKTTRPRCGYPSTRPQSTRRRSARSRTGAACT